jgi:arylsulfatase
MDQSIGRLVSVLRRLGQLDDTLILFLSDNGGCAELMAEDGWAKFFPDETHDGRKIVMGNIPNVRPGDALTYQSYERPWANVSNTPFRLFKHYVHEGGISTPLIAHWPRRIHKPNRAHAPCHVVDVLPTILEATGCPYPAELGGQPVQPLQGESFLSLLTGEAWSRQQPIFFEHEGNCAIRLDNFKLVRKFGHDWELYDMDVDRTELNDIAGRHAPLERDLLARYQNWAKAAGVLDWNVALPRLLDAWKMETVEG